MKRFPFFSPAGLLLRALLILAAWAIAHLLGWRSSVCVLSGTLDGGTASAWATFRGVTYAFLFLSVVLVAPIFALAAGLWTAARFSLRSEPWTKHMREKSSS